MQKTAAALRPDDEGNRGFIHTGPAHWGLRGNAAFTGNHFHLNSFSFVVIGLENTGLISLYMILFNLQCGFIVVHCSMKVFFQADIKTHTMTELI